MSDREADVFGMRHITDEELRNMNDEAVKAFHDGLVSAILHNTQILDQIHEVNSELEERITWVEDEMERRRQARECDN